MPQKPVNMSGEVCMPDLYYIQSEILSLVQGVLLLLPDDKLIVRDDDKLTCVSNDWHNDIMSASDKTIMDDHTRECP